MILIQHKETGELQLVKSLEGHDDCKILEEGVNQHKSKHATRENGKWKVDQAAHDKEQRHAKFRAMSRGELVEFIEERLDGLEARIAKLEAGLPSEPKEV